MERARARAPLLDDGGELADAAALLAHHVLGAGGADDDLRAQRRVADLDAGVAVLAQLALEELRAAGRARRGARTQ